MQIFDLNHAPFRTLPERTAGQVAEDFVVAFSGLEKLPTPMTQTFQAIITVMNAPLQHPLVIAGKILAGDIDTGRGAGLGNAYHNRQHFCEVVLGAHFLALLEQLSIDQQLVVIFAAMAHDFHHDGKMNGTIPFRLERLAVQAALPYLRAAAVNDQQQQEIAALILSTDMMQGIPVARASVAYHDNRTTPPDIPLAAPELALLLNARQLARNALLLCEADILPSVGLTVKHAMEIQANLAKEWDKPLTVADKYRFMQEYFPGFVIGTLFQSNVERLLASLQSQMGSASQ